MEFLIQKHSLAQNCDCKYSFFNTGFFTPFSNFFTQQIFFTRENFLGPTFFEKFLPNNFLRSYFIFAKKMFEKFSKMVIFDISGLIYAAEAMISQKNFLCIFGPSNIFSLQIARNLNFPKYSENTRISVNHGLI